MKTPTIKDIARESGVSHGTVSNVLNGKGNVSVEKIRRVQEAADRLGYRINAKAQVLRQGKNHNILLIVPGLQYPQYAAMYQVFQTELRTNGYTVQLCSTDGSAAEEKAAIEFALSSRAAAIVAVSQLDGATGRYRAAAKQMPVVLVDNHLPGGDNTIPAGFDYKQAGGEVAALLEQKGWKRIAVFSGSRKLGHIARFAEGLHERFGKAVTWVESADHLTEMQAFNLFDQKEPAFDAIVCTDEYRRQAVENAFSYTDWGRKPAFVTLAARRAIAASDGLSYELDYQRLAHRIVKRLAQPQPDTEEIRMAGTGFKHMRVSLPAGRHETLSFLTVQSPSSVALARLLPHFRKQTGIDVHLTVVGLDEVYNLAQDLGAGSQFDLVRMDMAWISELAPRIYAPLHTMPYDWEGMRAQMLPVFLEDYTSAGGVQYCLPYDPSTQIFFYRKDLFEDPTVRRMYYEACREQLRIPETFAQYNKVARFFTKSYNPSSPVPFGTTTAIGNSVVNPSEYMPRLFGEGGKLFDGYGRICLQTEPARRALENYMETYRYSDQTVYQWWKSALEGFANGSVAMTMVFMNYASDIVQAQGADLARQIGFAAVPGGKPLLGGGVVGITKGSRKSREAFQFLQWLYSDGVAPVFTMLGGLSPCRAVYNDRDVLRTYPWLSEAKYSFALGQRRLHSSYYRNFSEKKFEEILSVQVKRAVLGILPPDEALTCAQEECERQFIAKGFA